MLPVGMNQMPTVAQTRIETVVDDAAVEVALAALLEPLGPSRALALCGHVKDTVTHQSGSPVDTLTGTD
jgi:hypothetical protein